VEGEENPRDTEAPDDSPRPEPTPPSLEEVDGDPEAKPEDRLSKQVPIGVLFAAAATAILTFLFLVAVFAYFVLQPKH